MTTPGTLTSTVPGAVPGIVLSQLWIYPIKSAAGVSLSSARTALRGLEYDRRWMVVDAGGMLVTQRERPELSQVTPSLAGDALRVEAEGMPELALPLEGVGGQELTVKMWTEPMRAHLMEAATDWFSTFLGGAYRLVYMPDTTLRPSPDHAPSPVSFVDGNPFLVVSEASVADLNGRLENPVSSLNFRPNLVLRGCEAFAEDAWDSISVGSDAGVHLERVGPCVRCVLVNVDPASGTLHKEPLKTLARYRRVGNAVHFGQNFRYHHPYTPGTMLSCGDLVTVKGVTRYGAA